MGTILLHELKKMFTSSVFFVLAASSIVLFALNGAAFTHILKARQAVYESLAKSYDGKLHGYSQPMPYAVALLTTPPVMTSFIAEGGERRRPLGYKLEFYRGIDSQLLETNTKLPFIPSFDWVFIIKIIFSIYAMLLVFNAVSGERERGTLTLMLSNPVKRSKILFGKYISACIGFLIPLAIGMSISILILSLTFPQILSGGFLFSAALFFVTASIFLSAVALLGLLVSSWGFRSPIVLLLLFSFWVGMMITPNLSYLVANRSVHVIRDSEVTRETTRIFEEYSSNVIMQRVMKNEFNSIEEVKAAGNRMLADRKRLRDNLKRNRENSLVQRADIARALMLVSPMSVMQFGGEAAAGTGLDVNRRFMKELEADMLILKRYFTVKTGQPPENVFMYDGMNYVSFKGSQFIIGGEPFKRDMNFTDSPVIGAKAYSSTAYIPVMLRYLAILLLWNLVLAMGAFLAFNSADVR
jgi:ABC-type transport system involved in multi-copper enzyme maturation permease subunit